MFGPGSLIRVEVPVSSLCAGSLGFSEVRAHLLFVPGEGRLVASGGGEFAGEDVCADQRL